MTILNDPSLDASAQVNAFIHLRTDAVSVIFDVHPLPSIAYWGATLPDDDAVIREVIATASPAVMNSSFDQPRRISVFPGQHDGWSGTPAIEWHQQNRAGVGYELVDSSASTTSAIFELLSANESLRVVLTYTLFPSGVLAVHANARNNSKRAIDIAALRLSLPVPQRAVDLVDFTGRWSGERRLQRQKVRNGTWRRGTHRGRPGHDAAFITAVGTDGFGYGGGEVWATHVAWSGNQEQLLEQLPEGFGALTGMLAAGELLEPGEIHLLPGQSYQSPRALFVYSNRGLDGISQAFHEYGRKADAHPGSPRPLMLNTWEAIYFDHGLARILTLAERAAAVGVERFVLDDGWFRGRQDDSRGLGDWFADSEAWPKGLRGLSDAVHDLGMEFGLWFEPEMVNLDSDLARAHPDWVLGRGCKPNYAWRNQFVLDLTNAEAFAYIFKCMSDAVANWKIDFVKWDHNRDLHNPVSSADGSFSTHRQTDAIYRLIDALRVGHPGLEIESCASGGARVDAGIMQHAQRVWASDTNDPVERATIQQNTSLLLPPELIGVHVGPAEAHTTHRTTSLAFRLSTALFGHAGIEWDITQCSEEELAQLRAWSAMYRELRPLLHHGVTSHADGLNAGATLTTVATSDRRWALAAWTRLDTSAAAHSPRVLIPGLDPELTYEVHVRTDLGLPSFHQVAAPNWLSLSQPRHVNGVVLSQVGVPLPVLNPANTMLLEFKAILDNVN